jgi:hypothetical protein
MSAYYVVVYALVATGLSLAAVVAVLAYNQWKYRRTHDGS